MMATAIPGRCLRRFCSYVDQSDTFGCWPWTRYVDQAGYGSFSWREEGERMRSLPHRTAWWLAHGPIPKGMTVDHKCWNPSCCNPAHLQLLTPADNNKRKRSAFATHCPRGHAYDETNTYVRPGSGHRRCRECQRGAIRRYRQSRLALARHHK